MGWELRDFRMERTTGLASPFQFEILVENTGERSRSVLRGDGLVIRNSQLRLNRAEQLRNEASRCGLEEAEFLPALEQQLRDRVQGSLQPA